MTVIDKTAGQLEQVQRLERRQRTLDAITEAMTQTDLDAATLPLAGSPGGPHPVERIENQFGPRLVSTFLKPLLGDAWECYRRLRPTTVGQQHALSLSFEQFEAVHVFVHERLQLQTYEIELEAVERCSHGFANADRDQFAGPSGGSLDELRRDGLRIGFERDSMGALHRAKVRAAGTAIPLSEFVKNERIVTVSGKRRAKVSLVVHDVMDHLWTFDRFDTSGVFDEYRELLGSIGDPHLRDIRSREGEVIASIAYGVRMFNTAEPGFVPLISSRRLRLLAEAHVARGHLEDRHQHALAIVSHATQSRRFESDRPTLESQSLAFVFSQYISELNEQRRKHGRIAQRHADGSVRELRPLGGEFVSFFIRCHHELVKPESEFLSTLAKAQLLIEGFLVDVIEGRIDPPFETVITLDRINTMKALPHLPISRVRWMRDRYGFAATTQARV